MCLLVFAVQLYDFIYFGYYIFIRYMICKYLLPLDDFLSCSEAIQVDIVLFVDFSFVSLTKETYLEIYC